MQLKPITAIAVLLLVVASSLVSGCTSSTSPTAGPTVKATVAATATVKATATSTATATPTASASFDPLLAKLMPTLKAEYGSNAVTQRAKGTNINFDAVYITSEKNGKVTIAEIRNEGSIDAASNFFKTSPCISSDIKAPGSVTHLGQQAATVALGHAPTTVNDVYCKGTGDYLGVDNEYIQYDQLVVITTVTSEE